VLAEIAKAHSRDRLTGQEPLRRLTDHDLPAVRRRANPGRAMHVDPDVVPAHHPRLARVQPDPDLHPRPARPGAPGEPPLRRNRRTRGIAGAREDDEERVALRAQLVTAVRRDGAADDPAVLVKDVGVAFAKVLEKPRRALDIAEQQRDCAGRKRHRPPAIVPRRAQPRQGRALPHVPPGPRERLTSRTHRCPLC
jgi:hypothetical protein